MRKKLNIDRRKVKGYALQKVNEIGERTTIISGKYSSEIMGKFTECALVALEHSLDETYSIIQFKDKKKFYEEQIFDKEILNLNTKVEPIDMENAISYIECLEFFFNDRKLLEKIEDIVLKCYLKYNDNFNYRDFLQEEELKNLFRSVKNHNWEQYNKICDSLEFRAEALSVKTQIFERRNIDFAFK